MTEGMFARRKQVPSSAARITRRLCFACATVLALGSRARSQPAAEPIHRELRLIAQAMAFLRHPPEGAVDVAIVYPAGSPDGRAAAERIGDAFGSGVSAGSVILYPRLLTVSEISSTPGLTALLLTDAALPDAAVVAAAVAGKGVLTVAFDPAAVSAGLVVMAVRGHPRVEITVSRAAAQAAGVEFSTPFRLMIQER